MITRRHILHTLLFFAVACLALNDAVRLFCPAVQQITMKSPADTDQNGDNNPVNSFSILEEEVKHHYHPERLLVVPPDTGSGFDPATEHLIKDDEVRHLAYIPIFSPPPDRG